MNEIISNRTHCYLSGKASASLMVHTSKIMNKLPFVTKGNLNFLPLVVRQMRKYYSITAKMFCVDTYPIVTHNKSNYESTNDRNSLIFKEFLCSVTMHRFNLLCVAENTQFSINPE